MKKAEDQWTKVTLGKGGKASGTRLQVTGDCAPVLLITATVTELGGH